MDLTGAIDLVFKMDGKWYIADYKSNRCRKDPNEQPAPNQFSQDALRDEIFSHHYPFQYIIYSLALHRFLLLRLGDDYEYSRDFGGAYYLFLRGMAFEGTKEGHGVFFDKVPHTAIETLDTCFKKGTHYESPHYVTCFKCRIISNLLTFLRRMCWRVFLTRAESRYYLRYSLVAPPEEGSIFANITSDIGSLEDSENSLDTISDLNVLEYASTLIVSLTNSHMVQTSDSNARKPLVLEGENLYLQRMWTYENSLALNLKRLLTSSSEIPDNSALPPLLLHSFLHLQIPSHCNKKPLFILFTIDLPY